MIRRVIVSARASRHLDGLFDYLAIKASPLTAARYLEAITDRLQGLADLPFQGTTRDDVLAGLRVIGFRRRVTIAFRVDETDVIVLGVFYGGQDFEEALREA